MSKLKPSQECPICGAIQPVSAQNCSICGAVLPGQATPVAPVPPVASGRRNQTRYDPALGDDDLFAGDLSSRMWRLVVAAVVLLALLFGVVIGVVLTRLDEGGDQTGGDSEPRTELLTTGEPATAPPTATPRTLTPTLRPTLGLATITPAPPTPLPPTETPTREPCIQQQSGSDTVLSMAMRCGHRDMDVIDLILELNEMDNANQLQPGQSLVIPWPTPTGGAPEESNSETTPDSAALGQGETVNTSSGPTEEAALPANEFGTPDLLATYQTAEPTLRPGQAWHTVAPNQTIIEVAYLYDTDVETLSQINPEIPFLQCDYGLQYGGENCSVMLYEGQRVRVPVPLPTATSTATPGGTLTPTPTPTATYNAPYALQPDDGARFYADQRVTLRWNGTGTLADNERYLVRVRDMSSGMQYQALTTDTSYVLPGGWQPADRSWHGFRWTISVAVVDAELDIMSENHVTEPREFSWESR